MTRTIKYPHVYVELTGTDGNAFAVLAKVMRAMRRAGVVAEEIETFKKEATSGDYDNLLRTCLRWVDVA